jgi:hypothetical protein
VIDVTLAALFWSWGGDDDIFARLVKKTLFVGLHHRQLERPRPHRLRELRRPWPEGQRHELHDRRPAEPRHCGASRLRRLTTMFFPL